MSGALRKDVAERLKKLEKFYKGVANLTLNHDTLGGEDNETAVVYPSKLGSLLEAVDKEWWKG